MMGCVHYRPCILVLDSLHIKRRPIVNRINRYCTSPPRGGPHSSGCVIHISLYSSYLTAEWGVKRPDLPPMEFNLKIVYPKV